MKNKKLTRILSALLALVLMIGAVPILVPSANAGHTCPEGEHWIDGSPYCSECYACDQCIELCMECGKCTDCTGSEICDGCSDGYGNEMCLECSEEKGAHCPECDTCYFGTTWCDVCGKCDECCGICDECTTQLGLGTVCYDCAYDNGAHCPGCSGCYFEVQGWCEECFLCDDCSPIDANCSQEHGAILCYECVADKGTHCPDCGQCYFAVGDWCEECMICEDCIDMCVSCCQEVGYRICEECAIDQGLHCSDCQECYDGGEYCLECGICTACADYCSTDELCIDCAIAAGLHCPSCSGCTDGNPLCEGCFEKCLDCADAFCESCNLCSNCVLICQNCNSCEDCAVICPNCEEYCDQCEDMCDDCELCYLCCTDISMFEGCDCFEPVCVQSSDWESHYNRYHSYTGGINHSARLSPTWTFDNYYHWRECVYCSDSGHVAELSEHSFNSFGQCCCGYMKDAVINIIVEPKDSFGTIVQSARVEHDQKNIAHFSVKAIGNSELTYTWYEGYYSHSKGKIVYTLLEDPGPGEFYDEPDLYLLVTTDNCYTDRYVRCVITDEEGNEVFTRDALVRSRHRYEYFLNYDVMTMPGDLVERNQYGHVLQCIGENCDAVTHQRPHEDEDRDGFCDICDYEIGRILVTKQPKNSKTSYVRSPDEDWDETNFAHFSVEAEGDSALTYEWRCRKYVNGNPVFVSLEERFGEPVEGSDYEGAEISVLVPTDACTTTYYLACFITDEDGNETRTEIVSLKARHNYQYFKYYKSMQSPYEGLRRQQNGHFLQCVGEECEKNSRLRLHQDTDNDHRCDICDYRTKIESITLNITAPVEGKKPSYAVGCDSTAYYAYGRANNGIYWLVSDNGTDNWNILDSNTAFVAGKYYKFIVDLKARDGFEFRSHYQYNSMVIVSVNDDSKKTWGQKTYNKDLRYYITVEYNFGMCNDSVIENIIIDNLTEPLGGETPQYTADVVGNGYHIRTDYTRYEDDFYSWFIPEDERRYYIVNGIGWFDLTESNWVYSDEVFIPGHEYMVYAYMITEDGYEFAYTPRYYENAAEGSINGYVAEVDIWEGRFDTGRRVKISFVCKGKEITTVMVSGLATPKAGEHPDYTATVAYPEWYQLDPIYAGTNGIVWYDSECHQMFPEDTFIAGEIYRVELKIIPSKVGNANACQFIAPVSAYVNGNEVVANNEWDAVYTTANGVYIQYTFPKGAAIPAGKWDISGSVTSFGNASDEIVLQLIPEGYSEVAYETSVMGNNVDYTFQKVNTGNYTLKVKKNGHFEYTAKISVITGGVVHNVTLTKKPDGVTVGDVDKSGKINSADSNLLKRMIGGIIYVEQGSYEFKAGDMNGDGRINSADSNILKRIIAGVIVNS